MPAETHSRREELEVGRVLEFLARVIGRGDDPPREQSLAELELDDDLALLDLWDLVVEEYGERTVGEFDPPDPLPETLPELALAFHDALSAGRESETV